MMPVGLMELILNKVTLVVLTAAVVLFFGISACVKGERQPTTSISSTEGRNG